MDGCCGPRGTGSIDIRPDADAVYRRLLDGGGVGRALRPGELSAARQQILQAVRQAEYAGFVVGEDYSVTPQQVSGSAAVQNTAQLAESFAASIRERVLSLVALDVDVSSQITSAATGLQTVSWGRHVTTHEDRNPSIHMVDNKVIKEAPVPDPGIEPGSSGGEALVPSARAIRDAIKELPSGTRSNYLEVRDSEQLRQFGEWAKAVAHEYNSPNSYRGGRGMYQLPDGTIVSQGASVKHGLTMDIRMPDGSNYRIHVNCETSGNINMPRGAPIEPRIAPEPGLLPELLMRPGIPIAGVPQLVEPDHGAAFSDTSVLDAGGGMFGPEAP